MIIRQMLEIFSIFEVRRVVFWSIFAGVVIIWAGVWGLITRNSKKSALIELGILAEPLNSIFFANYRD